MNAPTFIYTSKCCGASVTKEPCVRSGTLGTWVCGACGMSCKVDRHKKLKVGDSADCE